MSENSDAENGSYRSVDYINRTLIELRMIAQETREELLAYTIGIAIYEADRAKKALVQQGRQPATNIHRLYLPSDVDQ